MAEDSFLDMAARYRIPEEPNEHEQIRIPRLHHHRTQLHSDHSEGTGDTDDETYDERQTWFSPQSTLTPPPNFIQYPPSFTSPERLGSQRWPINSFIATEYVVSPPYRSTPIVQNNESTLTSDVEKIGHPTRMRWVGSEEEKLVECWADIQRRYSGEAQKGKLLRPRGSAFYQELTSAFNVGMESKKDRTPKQIETKIRKMIDIYKEKKALNTKSGDKRHSCPFYDIFDEILGTRDSVMPRYMSQSNITNKREYPRSEQHASTDEEDDELDDNILINDIADGIVNPVDRTRKKQRRTAAEAEQSVNDKCDKPQRNKKKKPEEKENDDPVLTAIRESLSVIKSLAEDSRANQELLKKLLEKF